MCACPSGTRRVVCSCAVPSRVPPSIDDVRDLEILIRAHHPVIVLQTEETVRASSLVQWVADRLGMPYYAYSSDRGVYRPDIPSFRVEGSRDPEKCLDFILQSRGENLYFLKDLHARLEDEAVQSKLLAVAERYAEHRGAVLLPCTDASVPAALQRMVSTVTLRSPTPEQYYAFVKQVLEDLRQRMPVRVKLSSDDVQRLLAQLRGFTLFEVKKVLTKILVEDSTFTAEDISKIAAAKKEIVQRSGVLEYFAAEEKLVEIAGLSHLKDWLAKRKLVFTQPARAKQFGVEPPRGILLLGVQGCGKSMCAKAIAREWGLPLLRLDPSSLYNKYFGESEKNLKRATRTAEQLAPVVLWIDEMEKAFAQGEGDDSGTSQRIFGSFLHWMQEKNPGVFVVATCNDITKLPPELVRKGRFDEIFFVDLPTEAVRQTIIAVHLQKRGRRPEAFDLEGLAAYSDGFSGAELEQVVLSSLYTAFAKHEELNSQHLYDEMTRTVPLSLTASEKIASLRAWADGRTVPAD
jgi:hypothetical protein